MARKRRPRSRGRAAEQVVEALEQRVLLASVMVQWTAPENSAATMAVSAAQSPAPMALLPGEQVSQITRQRFGQLVDVGRYPALSAAASDSAALADSAPTVLAAGAAADAFIASHAGLFHLADPSDELQPAQVFSDNLGMTHVRYEQISDGVPVVGADVIVHLTPGGNVSSANGHLVSDLSFDPQVSFTAEQASAVARSLFAQADGLQLADVAISAQPSLCVLNQGILNDTDTNESYLVWQVTTQSVGAIPGVEYYLDAGTGEVRWSQDMAEGLNRRIYDGSTVPGSGVVYSEHYDPVLNYTFGRREGARLADPTRACCRSGTWMMISPMT